MGLNQPMLQKAASIFWMCALLSVCSIAQVQAAPKGCEPPQLLLIADFSNSMNWGINGQQNGIPSKLTVLRQAYQSVLMSFDNKINFGLITFTTSTHKRPSPGYPGDICSIQDPIITLHVPVGPKTAQRCVTKLNSLRAEGCTPMYPALQKAVQHYRSVIPQDTVKNRRRYVAILTDGVPNTGCPNYLTSKDSRACGQYLVQEVQKLRSLNVGGSHYDIKTYVIGFGNATTSLDTRNLNDMARAGGTSRYFQASDLSQLQKALQTIANSASGKAELCNGKDDNCNGQTDENLTQTCQGACGSGTRTCVLGKWTNCSAPATKGKEVCNNKDDDCNGIIDDNLTRECPKTNNCAASKKSVCVAGQWTGCTGGSTPKEVCNNKDDDCDGSIDEDTFRTCKTACGTGRQACISGDWSTCSAPTPSIELCDGLDNDCDGEVDEIAEVKCNGQCIAGKCYRKCNASECPGGYTCSGKICVEKKCEAPCAAGEICRLGNCVPVDCSQPNGQCNAGDICRNKKCVRNVCLGVTCGKGQFCRDGKCQLACDTVSCTPTQRCVDGRCIEDPCAGKTCPTGQACHNGVCKASTGCPQSPCPSTQACINGICVDDLCADVTCPNPNGKCIDGQCFGPQGPIHHDPSDPTKKLPPKTNPGTSTDGGAPTGPGTPTGPRPPRVKGGGCGVCSLSASDPSFPLSLLFLFVLLPFAARRKKQLASQTLTPLRELVHFLYQDILQIKEVLHVDCTHTSRTRTCTL